MKAFMLAGTNSGCGKTTITLGVMMALKRRGLSIQPYKVGPDYIDTAWHTAACARASRNLDAYMLPSNALDATFYNNLRDVDVGVIEGVMGLYDGFGIDHLHCSSAGMALTIGCPVILVVDGKATSTSAAAVVMGFCHMEPELAIAGVIFNQVNSDYHYQLLKGAVEKYCDVPVLGRVPKLKQVRMPERHLGLVTAEECGDTLSQWSELVDAIEEHVDLDQLLSVSELADKPASLDFADSIVGTGSGLTVAIAKDEAFNFYYQDNIDLLKKSGLSITYFSPLHDSHLPECDMIYLGGGYPELYAQQLSTNTTMREQINRAHQLNKAIYAECGGLMYLGDAFVDNENNAHPMLGILSGQSTMTDKLQRFGYCEATAGVDSLLGSKGATIRGHEFHYSNFETELAPVFTFKKGRVGIKDQEWSGGYQVGNTFASYLHVHFSQQPEMIAHWIKRARMEK